MLTAAQRRLQQANFNMLLDAGKDMEAGPLLVAIEAVMECRDFIPADLEAFAQRLSRRADDIERQSR